MRIGLITSTHTRHRFVANALARDYALPLVLTEEKRPITALASDTADGNPLILDYFRERAAAETWLLPEGQAWDVEIGEITQIPHGEINDPKWPERMRAAGVQLVAVFGSSILREPWLTAFPGRMVNIHLGLSPYYRGAATNFWPLYHEEPEYVGATIHLINPGVDTGAILRHARPRIKADDTPHTIGNRAIRAGTLALCAALREYAEEWVSPVPQWDEPGSRYCRNRDFTPEALGSLLDRWNKGLLPRLLLDFDRRRKAVPLIREL